MAIDVVMPQMGESIAEGTVVRWMKKPGEKVERDEPLLEISTDKVDAKIPSPAAGTLSEILVQEGQTVAVNSVVARIAGSGESVGAPAPGRPAAEAAAATPKPPSAAPAPEPARTPAPTPKPPSVAASVPPAVAHRSPTKTLPHSTSAAARSPPPSSARSLARTTSTFRRSRAPASRAA